MIVEKNVKLVPPRKDRCQECAVKHEPEMPHDATSLYWQTKRGIEKKDPSWKAAMEHCDDKMKQVWKEELLKAGIDIEIGEIYPG